MKPSDVLKQYGWCQGALATDGNGIEMFCESDKACSFCIMGAILRIYRSEYHSSEVRNKVRNKLISNNVHIALSEWNDDPNRTKKEVIELLESVGE